MANFEGQDRREKSLAIALEKFGFKSLDEANELCLSKGINVDEIVKGIQPIAFDNASWAYTLGCAIAIKKELIKNEDALNGIVNMALNIEGVKAGVLFKERGDNTTKVSLRTIGDINANKICSEFSGGGHKNAAGCTIELPLFKAKEAFIKLLSERI